MPSLTIGMATYEDFDGVYFTTQALRLYQDVNDVEIIVVDNNPSGEAAKHLQYLKSVPGVRYIPMPDQVGTAQSRNRVFDEAQGDFVLCMDCHVLLVPNAIARLKQYLLENPDTKDLLHGPILWDNLLSGATHFDHLWRSEMLGIWGQAWTCPCYSEKGNMRPPLHFSVLQHVTKENDLASYHLLKPGSPAAGSCPRCGKTPPVVKFTEHAQALHAQGYQMLGISPEDVPFEIPGQGLGLFGCWKKTWQEIGGFNRSFRGFGGEELYIHEKIRRNGGKVWCLPFMAWNHRFSRPYGVKFPLVKYQKVRNYVLGALELNDAPALAAIEEHFVKNGAMPREQWNKLLANPESEVVPPECESCAQNNGRPLPPIEAETPDQILQWCTEVPRDLNEHLPTLAEFAAKCRHVTEFSGRRESAVGLLAGVHRNNGLLVSYNTESDRLLGLLGAAFPRNAKIFPVDSPAMPTIEETDLLFLDTMHNFDRVTEELNKFAPKTHHYIVLHDTTSYGQGGDNGGAGLWEAMRQFMDKNSEWFICYHTDRQYGLTVLSKDPADKPEQKITPWPLDKGPGTELKNLLSKLNINPGPSCDCNARARQMDQWGVQGCRERLDEIVGFLKDGQERWGWAQGFKNMTTAGLKAFTTGIVFKISWSDPLPDLVRLAIDEAERKEKKEAGNE